LGLQWKEPVGYEKRWADQWYTLKSKKKGVVRTAGNHFGSNELIRELGPAVGGYKQRRGL